MHFLANRVSASSEVLGEILFTLSPDGFFTSLHPVFLQLTGFNQTEWLRKPVSNFVCSQDVFRVRDALLQVMSGETKVLEFVRCKMTGKDECPWNLSFLPQFSQGRMVEIFCIGERALKGPLRGGAGSSVFPVEMALLSNLLETFLANSPIGFCFFAEDFTYVCVNKALAALNGYAPEQHLGRTVRDLSPQLAYSIEPLLYRVLRTHKPELNIEIRFPHSEMNFEFQDTLASFYPILESKGNVVGVAAMFFDVTENARMLSRLSEQEDRLRLAVEAAALGTWDWDLTKKKLIWSKENKAMVGLPEDAEVDFDLFLKAVHPEDRERVQGEVERVLSRHGEEFRIEYRAIGIEDKIERWLAAQGHAYFDNNEKPVRFIGVTTDITDRKRTEEALQKLTSELARSNEELSRFASITSHDLKEPLRTITNFVALYIHKNRGKLDQESLGYLEYVKDGTRRMQLLIDDILRYSSTDVAKQKNQEVDLNIVLEAVLKNLHVAIEENETDVIREPLPAVMGNSMQLIQVFQNLVANAIKYRKQGVKPKIWISSQRREKEWIIKVKDNGIGFEMKDATKVFDAFQRLPTTSTYSGSGIGLATCRKIIEKNGGKIWAESELEKGSCFFFSIPIIGAI